MNTLIHVTFAGLHQMEEIVTNQLYLSPRDATLDDEVEDEK